MRGRGLGLLPGAQVEPGEREALRRVRDQAAPEIQVVHQVEDPLVRLLGIGPREQQPAHRQMHHLFPLGGDQRVGRLLDPVVQEGVRRAGDIRLAGLDGVVVPGGRQDQPLVDRLSEIRRRGLRRLLADEGEGVLVERVPDAGREGQGALGVGREPLDLPGHQVDDVVGHPGLRDGVHLEGPALPLVVEAQQLRLPERLEKLADEERIASGLLGDQAGQRLGVLGGRNAGCRGPD